jgi:hypothetical protein
MSSYAPVSPPPPPQAPQSLNTNAGSPTPYWISAIAILATELAKMNKDNDANGGGTAAKKEPVKQDPNASITPDQLTLLSQKISVEIVRLQASGTNDPVTQARVNVFTKIKQTVDSMLQSIQAGTMDPKNIPIKAGDYNNFLPALGDNSAGIPGLLSKSGYPTLSSLFNAYDAGDITGADVSARLMETYAQTLFKGLSYGLNLNLSYTSPNDAQLRQGGGGVAGGAGGGSSYNSQNTMLPTNLIGPINQSLLPSNLAKFNPSGSSGLTGGMDTNRPMGMDGSRGSFDTYIRGMDQDNTALMNTTPDGKSSSFPEGPPSPAGTFDWKALAKSIRRNAVNMELEPKDFGMYPDDFVGSPDFSWRGYVRMICARLATHSDPGVPEQSGCPPVSWVGWRS